MPWNWRDLALQTLLLWWRITKPTIIGVRGIITDEQGRVLFVQHNYGSRSWIFPGGGQKGDEAADESIVREMREETGLEVEVSRLVSVYLSRLSYKRDNIFVFECRQIGGTLQQVGGEIAEIGWFPPDAPPEPLAPGVSHVLSDWRQDSGVGYGRWED